MISSIKPGYCPTYYEASIANMISLGPVRVKTLFSESLSSIYKFWSVKIGVCKNWPFWAIKLNLDPVFLLFKVDCCS